MITRFTRDARTVWFALALLGCGSSESSTQTGSGGQAGVGGKSATSTGGDAATGGKSATTGGKSGSNMTSQAELGGSSTGGSSKSSTTGTKATGGTSPGGSSATGGKSTSTSGSGTRTTGGSSSAAGGTSSNPTTTATGGSAASGGSSSAASGGTVAAGGTTSTKTSLTGGAATGGSQATGGAATGGSQATGGSNTSGGGGLLAPANGALLGLFTPAQNESELKTAESQLGRKVAIHLGYFDWTENYVSFAQADLASGRIPYVTVEPWKTALDAISSGSEDATIKSRASAVAGLSGKILLRFAHEMNGNWYPWDGYHNGSNTSASQKYIAAYRHVHDVFASAGVKNVLWVFCPNVDSVPNESWNDWSNYYPGDSYVDWMCYDGYNWASDTFASLTSRIYPGLAAKNKPIMLGETSTQDAEKSTWISAIVPAMKSQFPMIKALVWFEVNKEKDWRYDSTSTSLSAFISMAKDPYFNP